MPNFKKFYLVLILVLFVGAGFFGLRGFLIQKNNQFKLNLGLELVGGSSLTLDADFPLYFKELGENSLYQLKKFFNDQEIFFSEAFVFQDELAKNHSGPLMIFSFNEKNFENCKSNNLFEKLGKNYSIILNERLGEVQISFNENYLKFLKNSALKESIKNISKRIDSIGNKEISIETLGENKLLLQAPGFDDPEKLKYLVGKTGKLTLHLVDDDQKNNDVFYLKNNQSSYFSGSSSQVPTSSSSEIRLVKTPILDGKSLKGAYANLLQNGKVTVHFSLNKEGAEIFGKITEANIGKRIAIVVDENVLSSPFIREKIPGGSVEISGSFDYQEASNLAASIRSGALPIRLFISEEKLVGAAAGNELIKKGGTALIIALVVVSFFMIFVYGFLGFVASFGILLNLFLILSLMIISESVLSLAGIAGLVLTVGIIVDNNVLIFERINDELKLSKKAYIRSVQNGFDRAIITITDSNLTTIIAASLLFFFGDNNLKGFALTLIYGVLISFFSTIWVSRIIIENFDTKILKHSFFLSFLQEKFKQKKKFNLLQKEFEQNKKLNLK